MGGVVLLALTFLAMWALFIVPQQRRVKAQRALVTSLAVGDDVMTTSGMFGTITALDDETATVRIADGVEVRFARGAMARRLTEPPAPADDDGVEPAADAPDLPVDD